jgi:hypothetical protein
MTTTAAHQRSGAHAARVASSELASQHGRSSSVGPARRETGSAVPRAGACRHRRRLLCVGRVGWWGDRRRHPRPGRRAPGHRRPPACPARLRRQVTAERCARRGTGHRPQGAGCLGCRTARRASHRTLSIVDRAASGTSRRYASGGPSARVRRARRRAERVATKGDSRGPGPADRRRRRSLKPQRERPRVGARGRAPRTPPSPPARRPARPWSAPGPAPTRRARRRGRRPRSPRCRTPRRSDSRS